MGNPVRLQHDAQADIYDPIKAHEYYLRTRQLKGLAPAAAPPPPPAPKKAAVVLDKKAAARAAAIATNNKLKAAQAAKVAAHKQAIEQEVIHLNARLQQLQEVLKKLVEEAKARSGVKPSTAPPTAAEKAKAAEAAKKADPKTAADKAKAHALYEKNKKAQAPKTPDQEVKQAQEKIKQVMIKIEKMRMDLQDAQKRSAAIAANNKKKQQSGKSVPAVKQTIIPKK